MRPKLAGPRVVKLVTGLYAKAHWAKTRRAADRPAQWAGQTVLALAVGRGPRIRSIHFGNFCWRRSDSGRKRMRVLLATLIVSAMRYHPSMNDE